MLFKTREAARVAIKRLHGKETLAGLRMRLFYLQQPQHPHSFALDPSWTAGPALTAAPGATGSAGAAAAGVGGEGLLAGVGGPGSDGGEGGTPQGVVWSQGSGGSAVSAEGGAAGGEGAAVTEEQGPVVSWVGRGWGKRVGGGFRSCCVG